MVTLIFLFIFSCRWILSYCHHGSSKPDSQDFLLTESEGLSSILFLLSLMIDVSFLWAFVQDGPWNATGDCWKRSLTFVSAHFIDLHQLSPNVFLVHSYTLFNT